MPDMGRKKLSEKGIDICVTQGSIICYKMNPNMAAKIAIMPNMGRN